MTAPLQVGLIGAGWVTAHHLRAWASLGDHARIVAIADPAIENARRRAAEFGIAKVYSDAAAMLAAGGLDAVDIAAPRAAHADLVRLAANHGLAVLCQKPLAPNLAEAECLVAETSGRLRLMVHENWRFRAYYRQMAAWLGAGRIGRPQAVLVTLVTSGTLPDAAGVYPALARQPFMARERRMLVAEVLIHHLDTLRMLFGPLLVTAAALRRTCPLLLGEDGAVLQLRGDGGLAIAVFASFAAHGAPAAQADRLEILGTDGAIRLADGVLTLHGPVAAECRYDLGESYQASYDAAIGHFVAGLRQGTAFETNPEDNLATLRLVEDCYRMAGWGP